jgi:hypothetical protein
MLAAVMLLELGQWMGSKLLHISGITLSRNVTSANWHRF